MEEELKHSEHNHSLLFLILGIVFILGGAGCALFAIFRPHEEVPELNFPEIYATDTETKHYSTLTGLEISDESLNNTPVYCMQIPNGLDGARPQTSLNEAGVVFEAIAERGVTRFAAIFQNPTGSIIGPIRSIRLYFLEWDTPFDCTIVHAGGSDDAIAAIRAGGYKDLTENYTYMYRGNYNYHLWNNLFTNANLLTKNSSDFGRTISNPKGFTRLTPEDAHKNRVDSTIVEKLNITKATVNNTAKMTPKATNIELSFNNNYYFNVKYQYNANSNSYNRFYSDGNPHTVYVCPNADLYNKDPQDRCEQTGLSPNVVVVIYVKESIAWDNYHENITTTGTGKAVIFQNGIAITGTWSKPSVAEQIKFYDDSGAEVALVPGQTWVEAIPSTYPSKVSY